MKYTLYKSQLRGSLQNTWQVLLKNATVINSKTNLRSCHNQEESKKMWLPYVTQEPEKIMYSVQLCATP